MERLETYELVQNFFTEMDAEEEEKKDRKKEKVQTLNGQQLSQRLILLKVLY